MRARLIGFTFMRIRRHAPRRKVFRENRSRIVGFLRIVRDDLIHEKLYSEVPHPPPSLSVSLSLSLLFLSRDSSSAAILISPARSAMSYRMTPTANSRSINLPRTVFRYLC